MMKFICLLCLVAVSFAAIPTSFDTRTKWPGCAKFILNQEQCGSCWDFCSVESFADRMCITGEAPAGTIISPEPILDCSFEGCGGGNPKIAWRYLINNGGTTCTRQCFAGCQPYDSGSGKSPACHYGTCDDGTKWPKTYYAASFNGLQNGNITLFQTELMNNGPLQACFSVYENFYDFFNSHPTGVYSSTSGNLLGGHCVKLIGWGKDASAGNFWLFANSWDTNWADQGFFRMKMGINIGGVENQISEGFTPKQAKALNVAPGIGHEVHDMIVGGWSDADVESELIQKAAVEAVRLVSLKANREFSLNKIFHAQTQVVAGLNIRLIMDVGRNLEVRLYRTLKDEFALVSHSLN